MSNNIKLVLLIAFIFGAFLLLSVFSSPNKDFAKVYSEYKQNGKQDKISPEDISKGFNN